MSRIISVFLSFPLILFLFVTPAVAKEPGWSDYRVLLKRHVKTDMLKGERVNRVDYSGIARDPRWRKVLQRLANYPLHRLKTRKERLAFYINAYITS